jgi:NADPH:quinone reductase-like Zn-dependent oxidoreductase
MDAAGVVERTGKTWGGYAEFMRVSARHVSPMPKSLNFAPGSRCSSCIADCLSGSFSRRKGRHDPGPEVLIHGAAGGVGSFAVQLAKSGGLLVAVSPCCSLDIRQEEASFSC